MRMVDAPFGGLVLLEPEVNQDERGFLFESFNQREFEALTGVRASFVQDNHSRSCQGVLRGLHYQLRRPQGKLMRVVQGSVYDIALDLRRSSPSFGRWYGCELSEENRAILWVPPGFAHGFLVNSPSAEFLYKTTDYWDPEDQRCIAWDDPELGIDWPLEGRQPRLSQRDRNGVPMASAQVYP